MIYIYFFLMHHNSAVPFQICDIDFDFMGKKKSSRALSSLNLLYAFVFIIFLLTQWLSSQMCPPMSTPSNNFFLNCLQIWSRAPDFVSKLKMLPSFRCAELLKLRCWILWRSIEIIDNRENYATDAR